MFLSISEISSHMVWGIIYFCGTNVEMPNLEYDQ